jgi:hypothetical protein
MFPLALARREGLHVEEHLPAVHMPTKTRIPERLNKMLGHYLHHIMNLHTRATLKWILDKLVFVIITGISLAVAKFYFDAKIDDLKTTREQEKVLNQESFGKRVEIWNALLQWEQDSAGIRQKMEVMLSEAKTIGDEQRITATEPYKTMMMQLTESSIAIKSTVQQHEAWIGREGSREIRDYIRKKDVWILLFPMVVIGSHDAQASLAILEHEIDEQRQQIKRNLAGPL